MKYNCICMHCLANSYKLFLSQVRKDHSIFFVCSLSDRVRTMVFTETRPRGPISAMHSTPGPVYLLPGLVGSSAHDPRSSHTKQPSYSFGLRHGKYRDDASPGPCYFPSSKIYRTGKDGTPHYSLYARRGDLRSDSNPGKRNTNEKNDMKMTQVSHDLN